MKHIPIILPKFKLDAVLTGLATQVVVPLAKQPLPQLDSVYPPSPYRKGFEFYQQQFKDAQMDIRKYPEVHCPYGKKGDLLYVQEAWSTIGVTSQDFILKAVTPDGLFTDRNKKKAWQPPATMPSVAARQWLRVTDIRLQRMQSLTKEQALFQGAEPVVEQNQPGLAPAYVDHLRKGQVCYGSKIAYMQWCKAVYGKLWDKNVWVWVVSFTHSEAPFKRANLT